MERRHGGEASAGVVLCVTVAFDYHQQVSLLPHQSLALVFTLEVMPVQLHHLEERREENESLPHQSLEPVLTLEVTLESPSQRKKQDF